MSLCNYCGKIFEEEADLYIHQNRTHDKRSFACEICNESLIGKVTLSNHMRSHKSSVGKSKNLKKCEACPYQTNDQANLNKHTKRVHSEKHQEVKKLREYADCGKNFSKIMMIMWESITQIVSAIRFSWRYSSLYYISKNFTLMTLKTISAILFFPVIFKFILDIN